MKKIFSILLGISSIAFFTASINQAGTINTKGTTVETRILPPAGYSRATATATSFTYYLRNLPLKPQGSKVHLYDNSIKSYQTGTCAVVDMEIGNTDLQQCAEAVMRLRAEYLWKQKRYKEIHFNFMNGEKIEYSRWAEGERITVRGSKVTWAKTANKDYSYITFRKYLDKVFFYAGTSSLSRELISVPIKNIEPGDVFIHGGTPGHAVIVIDVVKNANGQKAFICAQSFTPAQEIEILNNINNESISPWYVVKTGDVQIKFPQWTFTTTELKRFQ